MIDISDELCIVRTEYKDVEFTVYIFLNMNDDTNYNHCYDCGRITDDLKSIEIAGKLYNVDINPCYSCCGDHGLTRKDIDKVLDRAKTKYIIDGL